MIWKQAKITIPAKPRGFHLITKDVVSAISALNDIELGLLQIFIKHTSASLTINENADPDVRRDMETAANAICPESLPFVHTFEGPDDMPAHVKASLFGSQLLIPVFRGQLELGTWQGIYLCEHRERANARNLVLTLMGNRRAQ